MNFDYQQTQAELTYRLSNDYGWELKKVAISGVLDADAGQENEAFQSQLTQMSSLGWALVSIIVAPGLLRQSAISAFPRDQTSNYDLFWKRPKQVLPGTI